MDIATIIGIIGAWIVVISAIVVGGSALTFINIPSLLIVVGGGFMCTIARFPLNQFGAFMKTALGIAFNQKKVTNRQLVDQIYELANISRKNGLIGLDGVDISDDYLKKGIQLCVDGLDYEFVSDTLERERDLNIERYENASKIMLTLGDSAPAMGMIGTLVGLVQMLSTMDDPSAIGPAMAVALLTTLYGSLIQNLICGPIGDKVASKIAFDYTFYSLAQEGVLQIHKQQSPDMIVELLNAYLPASDRIVNND